MLLTLHIHSVYPGNRNFLQSRDQTRARIMLWSLNKTMWHACRNVKECVSSLRKTSMFAMHFKAEMCLKYNLEVKCPARNIRGREITPLTKTKGENWSAFKTAGRGISRVFFFCQDSQLYTSPTPHQRYMKVNRVRDLWPHRKKD